MCQPPRSLHQTPFALKTQRVYVRQGREATARLVIVILPLDYSRLVCIPQEQVFRV